MNNKILNFVATLVFAALLSVFMPWWSVMIAGFLSALLFPLKRVSVYLIPFTAILLYWAIYALALSSANDYILANKISELLQLGGNPYVLVLFSGLVGGIAAGIAAVFGNQVSVVSGFEGLPWGKSDG